MVIIATAQSEDISAVTISTFDTAPNLYIGYSFRRSALEGEFTIDVLLLLDDEAVLNDGGILAMLQHNSAIGFPKRISSAFRSGVLKIG
jgi:hypothetical protein